MAGFVFCHVVSIGRGCRLVSAPISPFRLRRALSRLWRRLLLVSRGEDPDLLDSDQPLLRLLLPGGLTDRDCLELLGIGVRPFLGPLGLSSCVFVTSVFRVVTAFFLACFPLTFLIFFCLPLPGMYQ